MHVSFSLSIQTRAEISHGHDVSQATVHWLGLARSVRVSVVVHESFTYHTQNIWNRQQIVFPHFVYVILKLFTYPWLKVKNVIFFGKDNEVYMK